MPALTETQALATENLVRLRSIKKNLIAMRVTNRSSESGLASHEKTHLLGMVEKGIDRCLEILTKDGDES